MFVHTFFEYADVTCRRILGYGIVGISIIFGVTFLKAEPDYVVVIITMYIFFAVMKGRVLEKVCVGILTQSIWCAFTLLIDIVFGNVLLMVNTPKGKDAIVELISMLWICLSIFLLKKDSIFNRELLKEHRFTYLQLLCIIILALEGDAILLIASFIHQNQLDIFFRSDIISLLLCGAALYMMCFSLSVNNNIDKEYYQTVNKTLQEEIKSQFAYYQKLEKVTKETRAIKHDMKNHLIVMKGLAEKKDINTLNSYIQTLQNSFERVSKIISTGNSILDSIVNEKLEIAKTKQIEMGIDVSIPNEIPIDGIDLCVMVANSLDNAIEACDKMKPGSEKKIHIYGRMERGFLSFIISNTIAKSVYVINNKIITDKLDKINHGYGLKNINTSVKRYQGKMKIENQDDEFTLYIDIPCKIEKE